MRRRLRLVIDTNVVISGLLWGGKPGLLLAHAGEGEISLHTSRPLLTELYATLAKPKLARALDASGRSPAELIADYRRLCTLNRPRLLMPTSRDPDDDHVIACALAARADFIVTGDEDLLVLEAVQGVRIMPPAAVLAELTA